jgi:nucleoside-diphosphate-sugar epimerase
MKILVTGGAGYKGIILTTKLLEKGFKVTVIDNFMYGYEPILHLATHPKLEIIKGDIRNKINHLHKYDVVFHLAGISGFPACAANPNSALIINVDATKKLVQELDTGQTLIYASTTSLYGKSGKPCDENSDVDPVSTYAMTKYEAEKRVLERENSIALRFATVFGFSPKMRMDLMINDFTYKALNEGVLVLFDSFAKRTFIHVTDAAECYLFAMEKASIMKGKIYNAGGNQLNYSKLEIAEFIKKKINFKIIDSEIKDKDLRHFIINFDRIEEIGFRPARSIEFGIDELLRIFSFYEYYTHFKII